MNGIKSALAVELIGLNKFEILASENKISLVSLKARDDKICSLILNNGKPATQISLSTIQEINLSENYQNISIVGFRAKEIAKKLQLKDFIEKDDTDILDLLNASGDILNPKIYIAKPLYLNTEKSNFLKYQGPKTLD
tara:strand:- start:1684 stop:2097 length:414 start_codon:yes stop_codon:yes gene_type:complete